jgi:predicted transcriptional regulator of viral defense system
MVLYFLKMLETACSRNIMRFLQFKEQLKDFTVFSLADVRMADGWFHRRRLNEWQEKGYIKKIVRGWYMFSDVNITEPVLYEIANRIHAPSYVSFETALAYYGLIPETVIGTVSASTRKTSRFNTGVGRFSYHTVTRRAFFGYSIVEHAGRHFKIAKIEKTIVDYFYLHSDLTKKADIESIRLNMDVIHLKVDWKKLEGYAGRVGTIALNKRLSELQRYIDNA